MAFYETKKLYSIDEDGKFVQTGSYKVIAPAPPLCFTAEEANSTITTAITGTLTKGQAFETSFDKINWAPFVLGETVITLQNVGDKVYFRGDNETLSESSVNYVQFVMTGKVSSSGYVDTLLNKDGNVEVYPEYTFCYLFKDCQSLTSPPLFADTLLGESCYTSMFQGCTSLTTAPYLPATVLATACYAAMFSGCTSLVEVPKLPATTLVDACYEAMFQQCTSLTTAPELPATSLETMCYAMMFYGCSSLNTIKIGYTGFFDDVSMAFALWLNGVSSTGDFYYNGTDTKSGGSGIPTGWIVHTF